MSHFEQASRCQLRFETTKGLLTVEDLWKLSLPSLDRIAQAVYKKLKESQEESFITKDTEQELRLEILKHVIVTLLQEAEDKKNRQQRRAEIELLKQLKETKKMESLNALTEADIDARLAALEV